jgi:hypothetical protein
MLTEVSLPDLNTSWPHAVEAPEAHSASVAAEHVGDVAAASVQASANGSLSLTLLDPQPAAGSAPAGSVGLLRYVMVLNNLPRSFLELRPFLEGVPHSIEEVMDAWKSLPAPSPPPAPISIPAPIVRRSLLQSVEAELGPRGSSGPAPHTAAAAAPNGSTLDSAASPAQTLRKLQQSGGRSAVLPLFGIVSASVAAVATCGNGVCEFGEAIGTWSYTDAWHCPEDCAFDLHACPQQVTWTPYNPVPA